MVQQDRTEAYAPELARILAALGHPEALISEDSWVSDILGYDSALNRTSIEQALSTTLGVDISLHDHLVDIAERMRALEGTHGHQA